MVSENDMKKVREALKIILGFKERVLSIKTCLIRKIRVLKNNRTRILVKTAD